MSRRIYVVPDVHFPYHDPNLVRLCCKAIEAVRPDEIVFIGDFFDCEQVSRYPHNAYQIRPLAEVVKAAHRTIIVPFFSKAPKAKKVFIQGNHEDRIRKYLSLHASALGGPKLVNSKEILGLQSFDEVLAYGDSYTTGKVKITHGDVVRAQPGASAQKLVEFFDGFDVLCGHTHRIGSWTKKTHDGYRQGFEIGHMTNCKDVPGWRPTNNWHASPGTIVTLEGKSVDIHVLRESKGRVVLPGEILK
jgi:predicted phosphodiesterase